MSVKIKVQTITMHEGTEGPRHDPYHFEELEVARNRRRTLIHLGLGDWVQIGREKIRKDFEGVFFARTGLTVAQARRAYERIHRVPKACVCGATRSYFSTGFPGESFALCVKCDAIRDYSFNESAVI